MINANKLGELGKNIKQIRKSKKLTQKQLANKIDKTYSSIQKYENGNVPISLKVLTDIAAALDVPVGSLLSNQGRQNINEIDYGKDKLMNSDKQIAEAIKSVTKELRGIKSELQIINSKLGKGKIEQGAEDIPPTFEKNN